VNTTSDFTGSEETRDGLASGAEDARLGIDFETTHGVVEHRGHDSNVEEIVELPLALEEFLAEGVLLGSDALVIVIEGLLEDFRCDTELLGKSLAAVETLHETTADVVLAVPFDFLGRVAIEDEADGVLKISSAQAHPKKETETHLAVLPHLASDVITVLKLVNKSSTGVIEEETTDTTECLSGQELDFGIGLVGVNQTSGVNLDLFKVDSVSTSSHGQLVAVTSAVLAVGGGEVPVLGAVLLQERALGEVGSVATSSKDDGAIGSVSLATVSVLSTNNGARLVLDELGDAGLLDDLDTLGVGDGEVLKTLHLSVSNDLKIS
jgi:hypothetical protein